MTSPRTNLGPLTTPFTYPASCTVIVKECPTCDYGWQAQTCSNNRLNTQGVQDNVRCWPEPENHSLSTGVALLGWGFYSPGFSCPVGYATSCLATGGVDGGFPFQFSLLENETAIGCCPTGFRCKYNPGVDGAQTCYSIATSGSLATVQCSSGRSDGFSYLEIPATVTGTVSGELRTTVLETVAVYAPLFQLNYQSTDLPTTATGPTDSSIRVQSATSSTPVETSSAASTSEGLSTGAKVGIGVGIGLGGLLLIGAALFFFLRGPNSKAAAPAGSTEPKPELAGQYVYPAELQSNPSPAVGRPELA